MNTTYINKSDILKWYIYKILLIMRLTAVIYMSSIIQVCASTVARKSHWSNNGVAPVKIVKEVKRHIGYHVVWYKGNLTSEKEPDISFIKMRIEDVIKIKGIFFAARVIDKVLALRASIDVRGMVVDENGQPMEGVVVKVKGTKLATSTNNKGEFILSDVNEFSIISISHVGYESKEIPVSENIGTIKLKLRTDNLQEVEILSTGYQNINRELSTGSHTLIDNKLLNRAVSSDLISRLKGVTNGLLVDGFARTGNSLGISVRGRSTLYSETKPLIVVDNFPFEGDLNSINPNDVENVTVLKDAAAAAIWGVRAGNGVIVITTKKGTKNQKTLINFNSNLTVGDKPDIFYTPQMTSSEFIQIEKYLYGKGHYDYQLGNDYDLISPVVQLLSMRNSTNEDFINNQIKLLENKDARIQIDKYLYRESIDQQYHSNIQGGGKNSTFNISAGFDKKITNQVGNSNNRYSLKAVNVFELFNDNFIITSDVNFTRSIVNNGFANGYSQSAFPYEQIADDQGNALAVLQRGGLRASYTDTAGNGQLLNWKYKPLNELRSKSNRLNSENNEMRINTNVTYRLLKSLSASALYQFYETNTKNEFLADLTSFFTRDAINSLTQINRSTGEIKYPMPKGAQFITSEGLGVNNYGRIQLDYQNNFLTKHYFSAISGYEIRAENNLSKSLSLIGYDPETGISIIPNNSIVYFNYWGSGGRIFNRNNSSIIRTTNRYLSLYANASYSFDRKYVISGSYRKDKSNIFGVSANLKGVPLWSMGTAWNIDNEKFFNVDWLHKIQLRASFGYSGNVNRKLSGLTTASASNQTNPWNTPLLTIINPPNPSLSWERVKNLNIGIDFSLKNSFITGSIEIFEKTGVDLIGTSPISQQTGVSVFTGNVASTKTKGMDIQISSKNLDGQFKWTTNAIMNIAKDKIIAYMPYTETNSNIFASWRINPIVGYPISSIFSHKSTSLDSLGNPQGYLNGSVSQDYTEISNSTNRSDLKYHGSGSPIIYGAIRNTFSFKEINFSFNLTYKLGYFFRRSDIFSGSLEGDVYNLSDYNKRWQNKGDELFTSVPSVVYPTNYSRSLFYQNTENAVEKGDHIRLNDIQLSYNLPQSILNSLKVTSLSVYAYVNNLGIIWRSNNKKIDPDAVTFPLPKSFSIGIKSTF